jgi:hypothetical protein
MTDKMGPELEAALTTKDGQLRRLAEPMKQFTCLQAQNCIRQSRRQGHSFARFVKLKKQMRNRWLGADQCCKLHIASSRKMEGHLPFPLSVSVRCLCCRTRWLPSRCPLKLTLIWSRGDAALTALELWATSSLTKLSGHYREYVILSESWSGSPSHLHAMQTRTIPELRSTRSSGPLDRRREAPRWRAALGISGEFSTPSHMTPSLVPRMEPPFPRPLPAIPTTRNPPPTPPHRLLHPDSSRGELDIDSEETGTA